LGQAGGVGPQERAWVLALVGCPEHSLRLGTFWRRGRTGLDWPRLTPRQQQQEILGHLASGRLSLTPGSRPLQPLPTGGERLPPPTLRPAEAAPAAPPGALQSAAAFAERELTVLTVCYGPQGQQPRHGPVVLSGGPCAEQEQLSDGTLTLDDAGRQRMWQLQDFVEAARQGTLDTWG
jgi:hypothetical protein